ncbi:hypothetical protein NQK81_27775 [Amycolatopsis roodepoortensis]|uniref:hypothetical protein n=1 Tax=Amycolatopsis roodepoortensis TaxID=700274 RepID=UPI00214C614A|nr:hypothetical protein [Amycolatopsis roodepoortensis]UUV28576.1 hypothetical protein NQK81_27775 [Amycolatopsis roodepoortensis]
MCYADTTDNPDSTTTAHCYCGWSDTYPDHDTADAAAAETHSRDAEAAEAEFAAAH